MSFAIASDDSNIKTGDLVLVRNDKHEFWKLTIFYRAHVIGGTTKKEYECLNDYRYYECVPYESNQELAGTNQRCTSGDYIPKIYEHVNFTYAGTKYLDGVVVGFNTSNDDEPLYTVVKSTYNSAEFVSFEETIFKVNKVEPYKEKGV